MTYLEKIREAKNLLAAAVRDADDSDDDWTAGEIH